MGEFEYTLLLILAVVFLTADQIFSLSLIGDVHDLLGTGSHYPQPLVHLIPGHAGVLGGSQHKCVVLSGLDPKLEILTTHVSRISIFQAKVALVIAFPTKAISYSGRTNTSPIASTVMHMPN